MANANGHAKDLHFNTLALHAGYSPDPTTGAGAIIGFGIKGGKAAGKNFIDNLKIFSHLANVGDSRSLAIHPATTTHSQLNAEEQAITGVTDDYVRLAVGLEDINNILWDLDQALAISQGTKVHATS